MEIIIRFQVCIISRINFDYKVNGGKKIISSQTKESTLYLNEDNMIIVPNHEKNKDYDEVHVFLFDG